MLRRAGLSAEGLFALALTALVTLPSGARAQEVDCASIKSMPLMRGSVIPCGISVLLISCVLC